VGWRDEGVGALQGLGMWFPFSFPLFVSLRFDTALSVFLFGIKECPFCLLIVFHCALIDCQYLILSHALTRSEHGFVNLTLRVVKLVFCRTLVYEIDSVRYSSQGA